jgi:hypothetical protein
MKLKFEVVVVCIVILFSAQTMAQSYEDVWPEAQLELSKLDNLTSDPRAVTLDQFKVELKMKADKCGKVKKVVGCFQVYEYTYTNGTTKQVGHLWYLGTPAGNRDRAVIKHIMKHEACHAILWAMGDSRWALYDHVPELRMNSSAGLVSNSTR